MLYVGIKYSLRGVVCDVINNVWPTKQRYALHTVNDISVLSGIGSPQQAVNPICKPSFRWKFKYKLL